MLYSTGLTCLSHGAWSYLRMELVESRATFLSEDGLSARLHLTLKTNNKMVNIKEKTVAIAGNHTAEILSGKNDTNLLNVLFTETYLLVASLYQQGFKTFHTGMADGFETIAADAVRRFQKEKTDIELVTDQPDSEMQPDEYLLANSSLLICYCDHRDNNAMRIFERAKKGGMPATNLYTLLTDYFTNNSPAKRALRSYNNIDGFSYCKEGILLCYLYGEKPIIAPFENIEQVEQRDDKLYVTLTNKLEVDAYLLSE